MEEHNCILYSAYQKFYSALNSLAEFNESEDFFDSVSKIDNFFSEFRNITFVLQKKINGTTNEVHYSNMKIKYLDNLRMKWFVEKRNQITKEKPIELEKIIYVRLFTNDKGIVIIENEYTIKNWDKSNVVLDEIKNRLSKYKNIPEVYLSIDLIFKENNVDIDMLANILDGLDIMYDFLIELENLWNVPDCKICKNLKSKIKEIIHQITLNYNQLTKDCIYIPKNDEFIFSDRWLMAFGKDNGRIIQQKKLRVPLKENLFFPDISSSRKIFEGFMKNHILIYQVQKLHIMPTYFLIYEDDTISMQSFHSSLKTTFYRTINDITKKIKPDKIKVIMYVGELYLYDFDEEILSKNSIEKEECKRSNCLVCSYVDKDSEKHYLFDSEKVFDMEYVKAVMNNNSGNVLDMLMFNTFREELNRK